MNEMKSSADLTDEERFALPEETRFALYLPFMHAVCTALQNWRHCRLPRCRRARACSGAAKRHRPYDGFPPCIIDNSEHARFVAEIRRMAAEGDQS